MTEVSTRVQRRLAAILAADVVGFSTLMSRDEEGTLTQIKALEHEVIRPAVQQHRGRVVKTTGDGFLIEFGSPVEAVRCAVSVQKVLTVEGSLKLRIGINLGDVIVEPDGDVYGEGVNIAARLEALCDPGGVLISGKVHDEVEGKVEAGIESRGEQPVKNIPKPVRVYALNLASSRPANESKPLPLPDKPSIAVLPFTNMSGDPEQEYFADGVVEDIITALSRIRSFFVIARNSSFTYKGRAVDIRQVGRELGVRYVLEGSIRKAGNRVRITGQLIEAGSGRHIWADKFDGALEDIFELQDRITERVVSAIEPSLTALEIDMARAKSPESLSAYDLYLRALPEVYDLDRETYHRAERLLRQAIELDPNSVDALAALAFVLGRLVLNGWASQDAIKPEVLSLVRRAIHADPDHGAALATASWSYAAFDRQHEAALELAERALRVHPNSAFVRGQSGWVFLLSGEFDQAIANFQVGLRLNPLDPRARILLCGIGAAHFFARRFEEAVAWNRRSIVDTPTNTAGMRYLAASLAHTGQSEEAHRIVSDLLAVQPNSSLSRSRSSGFRYSWMMDLYIDGLRKAGLPE
jgi:adenylate cyclase